MFSIVWCRLNGQAMGRALAVTVALGLLLVIACSSAERDSTGEIVEAGDLSVFSLRAGDCIGDVQTESEEVGSFKGIPCDQPHEAEVYLVVNFPGGSDAPFPGARAFDQFAEDLCVGAFQSYVGIAYDSSEIYAEPLVPTKDSWEKRDDREIVCVLFEQGFRKITGSLRNARR